MLVYLASGYGRVAFNECVGITGYWLLFIIVWGGGEMLSGGFVLLCFYRFL